MMRLGCWWRSHPLRADFEIVQHVAGPAGIGVIVRRRCECGSKFRLGYAVEFER